MRVAEVGRDATGEHQTATNPSARWLFPGRRAGRPLTATTLQPLIHELGIPNGTTRVAALRQLVLQAPAPVIAKALGFHHITTPTSTPVAPGEQCLKPVDEQDQRRVVPSRSS
ncbi:MAG: hypothetical protein LC749_11330 [Actinobacteria bacterium]|nr:hypothetical protein [Actinomycetota bacterium]